MRHSIECLGREVIQDLIQPPQDVSFGPAIGGAPPPNWSRAYRTTIVESMLVKMLPTASSRVIAVMTVRR